ncbi:MAG: GerMN domain-containing protein [Eubacterium sp.]|nr:GerMN domain-containing protein [Eubacterium sp.]
MTWFKDYKGILVLLMATILLLATAACGRPDGQEDEHKGKTVTLYYLDAEGTGFVPVSYTLENLKDPHAETNEILRVLSSPDENRTSPYQASIPKEVAVNSIEILEGQEKIDFGAGYNRLDDVEEAMMRISVVKSVLQIDGVDSVSFSVDDTSLIGTDGVPVGLMTDDTFILDDEDSESVYTTKKRVTLYYADKSGKKMAAVDKTLTATDNMPMTECILNELKNPPEGGKYISPLPPDLKIRQVQIRDNICYVDLSSDIETLAPDVDEQITVYSMVNSLASLNASYQVQFTVEGKRRSKLNDFKGFDGLLSPDLSYSK